VSAGDLATGGGADAKNARTLEEESRRARSSTSSSSSSHPTPYDPEPGTMTWLQRDTAEEADDESAGDPISRLAEHTRRPRRRVVQSPLGDGGGGGGYGALSLAATRAQERRRRGKLLPTDPSIVFVVVGMQSGSRTTLLLSAKPRSIQPRWALVYTSAALFLAQHGRIVIWRVAHSAA
jgi:hypothetical protein